jgi:hypothetical protein
MATVNVQSATGGPISRLARGIVSGVQSGGFHLGRGLFGSAPPVRTGGPARPVQGFQVQGIPARPVQGTHLTGGNYGVPTHGVRDASGKL